MNGKKITGVHRKRKRHKHRERRRGRVLRALGVCASCVCLACACLGLAGALAYKSGQAKLSRPAAGGAPAAALSDAQEELVARERARLATVPWQEGWVALDGRVYEYAEGAINLLFLGIDRAGEVPGETDLTDWGAGQADAIFVVSLSPEARSISIVGIPRNSMVDLEVYDAEGARTGGLHNQICLQYGYAGGGANGLACMEGAVSRLLYNLPIHGAFAVGLDAVAVVNDSVGGVEVEVPEDMAGVDPAFRPGERVRLTGQMALQYVRSRNYGALGSPTQRLHRQRQYITGLVAQTRAALKENPLLIAQLYSAVMPYMNTDVSLDEAVYLAREAAGYRLGDDAFRLLGGRDEAVRFTGRDGSEDFYDDYYLDEEGVRRAVVEVFYREVRLAR